MRRVNYWEGVLEEDAVVLSTYYVSGWGSILKRFALFTAVLLQ